MSEPEHYGALAHLAARLDGHARRFARGTGEASREARYYWAMHQQLWGAMCRAAGVPFPALSAPEGLSLASLAKADAERLDATRATVARFTRARDVLGQELAVILPLSDEWKAAGWRYVASAPCPRGRMKGKHLPLYVPVLRMSHAPEHIPGRFYSRYDEEARRLVGLDEEGIARAMGKQREEFAEQRPIDFALDMTWREALERVGNLHAEASRRQQENSDEYENAGGRLDMAERALTQIELYGPLPLLQASAAQDVEQKSRAAYAMALVNAVGRWRDGEYSIRPEWTSGWRDYRTPSKVFGAMEAEMGLAPGSVPKQLRRWKKAGDAAPGGLPWPATGGADTVPEWIELARQLAPRFAPSQEGREE